MQVEAIMLQERSYDALPNFTAADCKETLDLELWIYPMTFALFRSQTIGHW